MGLSELGSIAGPSVSEQLQVGCGARGQVAALVKWGSANGTYDATP